MYRLRLMNPYGRVYLINPFHVLIECKDAFQLTSSNKFNRPCKIVKAIASPLSQRIIAGDQNHGNGDFGKQKSCKGTGVGQCIRPVGYNDTCIFIVSNPIKCFQQNQKRIRCHILTQNIDWLQHLKGFFSITFLIHREQFVRRSFTDVYDIILHSAPYGTSRQNDHYFFHVLFLSLLHISVDTVML